MKYIIGIDVGGTKIAYGLFDQNKNLIARYKKQSDASLEANLFFDNMIENLHELLGLNNIVMEDIDGIGIGMPSFIEFQTGYIVKTGSLPKIKDFHLHEYLYQKLDNNINIVIDNDANTGALAEYRCGLNKEFKHIMFCPVSTGISTGIIIHGELFRGSYGWAGESGHMLTSIPDKNKLPVCGCNNSGCLNYFCAGKMIINHIKDWVLAGEDTIMIKLADGINNLNASHINQAYNMGDEMAYKAIEQMAQYMAIWLYNLYVVLNINCIVFSGGLLAMGEKLFGRVRELFHEYNKSDFPVYFFETKLGEDAGIIGAMELLF